MIINKHFEEPYNKFAPEGPIPVLSKTIVKSRLSNKFWKNTQKIYDEVNNPDQENLNYDINKINNLNLNNALNNNTNDEYEKQNQIKEDLKKNKQNKLKSGQKNLNINYAEINEKLKNEIEEMKNIISNLQNELSKKDMIIENQNNEKIKLTKRVEELESVLSQYLEIEKNSKQ
jgi:exonuclease VII large subunit